MSGGFTFGWAHAKSNLRPRSWEELEPGDHFCTHAGPFILFFTMHYGEVMVDDPDCRDEFPDAASYKAYLREAEYLVKKKYATSRNGDVILYDHMVKELRLQYLYSHAPQQS